MKRPNHLAFALVCLTVMLSSESSARAQDLQHARRTLARNPEAARLEATELLESGVNAPEALGAIHRLLAEAAGQLGDDAAAVRSFTIALALDPTLRVERTAPPEIRSPYMEAAGFWSAHATRLTVEVGAGEGDLVLVRVIDPASIAARVRIRARLPGGTFVELVRPTNEPVEVSLDGLTLVREVQYSVALIDEFGNRLLQRGSDQAPEILRLEAPAPPPAVALPPTEPPPTRTDPLPYYVAAGIAGVLGLGGIVGGAIMHVERESLAGRWNAGDCDGAGLTRGEVCSSERAAISNAETIAGVLYGVGGAALAAAAVTALMAPSGASPAESATVRCTPGPGEVGLSCGVTF
jgi:hypothetical protein